MKDLLKKFKMPHSIVIIYVLLIPVTKIPQYVFKGFDKQSKIVWPLVVIGASIEVVLSTGMFHALLNIVAKKYQSKRKVFLTALLFLFSMFGIILAPNKFIAFAPLGVMIAQTLGYDGIVGVSIILLGVGVGFSCGTLSPTTAFAQSLAELPAYSGMWMRVLSHAVFYAVTLKYILSYAEKVRKDPTKSCVYGEKLLVNFDPNDEANNIKFEARHKRVLVVFLLSFIILGYGSFTRGWGFTEAGVCMFWMGLFCGLANGYGPSEIARHFQSGLKAMAPSAFLVGSAGSLAIMLSDANIMDTVIHGLASSLNLFPNILKPSAMFIMNNIVNFFIVSGSGQAAAVMPIFVPMSDLAGISRQICVLVYKYGDGFCNNILPHNSSLMGMIGAVGIGYGSWMKFMGKLFGLYLLTGCVLSTLAFIVGY